jgi:GAF domain-containing protein
MSAAERERAVREAVRSVEEAVRQGEPLHRCLAPLTRLVETLSGHEVAASILVLDGQGLLRNGASPSLPADYLAAIDGIRPHPEVGTCAAAAASGEAVITVDFQDDSRWAELRHLPQSIGYVGAWSQPIKSADGRVLGTFGTYFRERRAPEPGEVALVQALLPIAARAIEAAGTVELAQ